MHICFGFGALQSAHCFVKAVRACRKHALRDFSLHCLSLMRQNCRAPEDEGFPSETRQTSEVVVSALLRASLTQYWAERPVPRAEQICSLLPKHEKTETAQMASAGFGLFIRYCAYCSLLASVTMPTVPTPICTPPTGHIDSTSISGKPNVRNNRSFSGSIFLSSPI